MKEREREYRAWDGNRMIFFESFSIGLEKKGKAVKPYVYFQWDTFHGQVSLGKHKINEWINIVDKNLQRVFTGDIVEDDSTGFIGVVCYNAGSARMVIANKDSTVIKDFGCFLRVLKDENTMLTTCKVIGHIYKNENLLK